MDDGTRPASGRCINPWTWQDAFAYSQAIEIPPNARLLHCAGQTSIDASGAPRHAGDMAAQVRLALDNLEIVLAQAGYGLGDLVRLNWYTTDVDALFANWGEVVARLQRAGRHPASTLLGVARLAFPELMVEVEATAAR